MGFVALPKDLKNMICAFAYDSDWELVKKDMDVCFEIKTWDITPLFVRDVMWSRKYRQYIPSPLKKFEPIANFTGEWTDYIDWHTVQELMWRLDFRRKAVKYVGSRQTWRTMFKDDWTSVQVFDSFYRFLLYTRVPCFKPLWSTIRFDHLKSYMSPVVSARWWLEEFTV